jgi:hypothetical protein
MRPFWWDAYLQFRDSLDLDSVPPDDQVSKYSQIVSRFLNGPMLYPDIQLERRCCPSYFYFKCFYGVEFRELLPNQLLDVCRTLSNEAKHIFYSKSRFSICRSDPGGLSSLFTVKPQAISWISSLCIRLNICECLKLPICVSLRTAPSIAVHATVPASQVMRNCSNAQSSAMKSKRWQNGSACADTWQFLLHRVDSDFALFVMWLISRRQNRLWSRCQSFPSYKRAPFALE